MQQAVAERGGLLTATGLVLTSGATYTVTVPVLVGQQEITALTAFFRALV